MAIEDEIINISDIDIGTEVLKSDKLLIETNNGTKMIAFKDFVVGPDNISSIREDQIEGDLDAGTARSTVLTGFQILNDQTTPGLKTKYNEISGTVELGKFNYNAIANLAAVSGDIATNASALAELRKGVDKLLGILEGTSSSVLNSIVLSTSATNFTVEGATGGFFHSGAKRSLSFSTAPLDPSSTNANASLTLSPFKVTFPSENEGFEDGTRFSITGDFMINRRKSGVNGYESGTITLYKDSASGASQAIYTAQGTGNAKNLTNPVNVNTVVKLTFGDSLRLIADSPIQSGSLHGYKI